MNKVNLVGRICNDLKLMEFGDSACLRFTVACDDGKDKNGEKKSQFIDCIAWNKLADAMNEFAYKGMRIAVSGKLNKNVYDDKDGVTHYQMEVLTDSVEFLESKKEEPKEEKKESSDRKRSYRR